MSWLLLTLFTKMQYVIQGPLCFMFCVIQKKSKHKHSFRTSAKNQIVIVCGQDNIKCEHLHIFFQSDDSCVVTCAFFVVNWCLSRIKAVACIQSSSRTNATRVSPTISAIPSTGYSSTSCFCRRASQYNTLRFAPWRITTWVSVTPVIFTGEESLSPSTVSSA